MGGDVKASLAQNKVDMQQSVQDYLNKNDRFATRMKASLAKKGTDEDADAQAAMFVQDAKIDMSGNAGVNNTVDAGSLVEPNKGGAKALSPTVGHQPLPGETAVINKSDSCCPNMTPFILMIALAVHAVFEGLALGLTAELKDTINITIAILIHKGAAGSSLGISLVKTFPNDFKLCRWLVFIFAIASPLGVAIGMILKDYAGEMVQIVFTCLAAGSFVYIGCSEIIVEEFSIPGNRLLKLFFFLLGAAIITCLWFLD